MRIWSKRLRRTLFFDESGGGVTFQAGNSLSQSASCRSTWPAAAGYGYYRSRYLRFCVPPGPGEDRPTELFLFRPLKMMELELHKTLTVSRTVWTCQTWEWLAARVSSMIIRVPTPGINDTAENIEATGKFLSELSRRPGLISPHHSSPGRSTVVWYELPSEDLSATVSGWMEIIAAYLARSGITASIGRLKKMNERIERLRIESF